MKQKAFTLIELMIVIAIVGILSAVAIPTCQDYLIRARVMEGLSLVATAKFAVTESAILNNALPANQQATGYTSPSGTSNVASVAIADGTADVIVTYTKIAGNGTIVFHPVLQATGDVTWDCIGGTLLYKYRPSNCRQLLSEG
jgi:type IV pilus assembly protein PilA